MTHPWLIDNNSMDSLPQTDYGYVYTVTLTVEIFNWDKVIDKNYINNYRDQP